MNNAELRINGRLADTTPDLGVRLNRKLIDPGVLNSIDAQYSYTITLPSTQNNNEIFYYANVEETNNKFNRVYSAELIINGVRVFGPGLFRLTSVTNVYKGQLYLPAKKTVKVIFGAIKLNANPDWRIAFADFATSVNSYNAAAATAPQAAIFPYIMYGLLPKVPVNKDTQVYSARTLWDASVRFGIQDLPPAINTMLLIKHIFNSQGYNIQGTAFQDARLLKLYESYKNAPTYTQPWNYGQHARIHFGGQWSNWKNPRLSNIAQYEKGALTPGPFITDLFDATNTLLTISEDPGGNILYNETVDAHGRSWVDCQVSIPVSGFYKIEFNASIHLAIDTDLPATDSDTGIQYISAISETSADFTNNIYELRVCRDNNTGDFGLDNGRLDGNFYGDNQPQNNIYDANNIPKYLPAVDANGQINFIDKVTDKNIVVGFRFGDLTASDMKNPLDTDLNYCQVQAAKPALSWDNSENDTPLTRLAIKAPGYYKFGRIGDFDTPGENPDIDLDYSTATRVNDKDLDANGNPGATDTGNVILYRFPLERYYTYTIDGGAGYTGTAYVHDLVAGTAPILTANFVGGVATFDTSFTGVTTVSPHLTIYLKTATFDVDGTLTINRAIDDSSADVIGWEATHKYYIDLENAPDNFAKRGKYASADADRNNNAQGSANAVVWLNAGELITVAVVSNPGTWIRPGSHTTAGYVRQNILYDLSIQAFREDAEWLKVNSAGDGTGAMSWLDPVNFDVDNINLVGFLDAETNTDDFINNFCATYNLNLSQVDAQTFSLDVRQSKSTTSNVFTDLDGIASLAQRENTPLGLPSRYVLGFTIDTEEEGYVETGETGGGTYDTGATEENIITQNSAFSYNWYKTLTKVETPANITISVPIICKSEAWDITTSYPDAMKKRYTDQAQRFMYYNGILPGTYTFNGAALNIASVRNDLPGVSILNYKNVPFTILTNYFQILISGASHYTAVKAVLTALGYSQLDGSRFVRFNGDAYYVAELTGYDPYARNETTIKLIRKI